MSLSQGFEEKKDEFISEFFASEEYLALKKADQALYQDKDLLALTKKKKDIEERLSAAYLKSDGSEKEILREYAAINKEISSLPSVIAYEKCYAKIKAVKEVFENEILRRLI
ncbi:MAG: YlbF family regulator [Bacilli bacterium]|jgi:hypothetical protein|nr:YlbF family regulator [Bacilli bacterium]